jgi:hypothetical protein
MLSSLWRDMRPPVCDRRSFSPMLCMGHTHMDRVHATARPKRFGSLNHGLAAGLNVPCLGTLVAVHLKAGRVMLTVCFVGLVPKRISLRCIEPGSQARCASALRGTGRYDA